MLILSLLTVIVGDSVAATLSFGKTFTVAWSIIEWPLALVLLLFAFAITFYFGPNLPEFRWHWITPGAVVGVCLLIIVSLALRIYLHYSGSYTATYGSLGGVILLLLLCFYLSGVAVLSGGSVNGVLESLAPQDGFQPKERSR